MPLDCGLQGWSTSRKKYSNIQSSQMAQDLVTDTFLPLGGRRSPRRMKTALLLSLNRTLLLQGRGHCIHVAKSEPLCNIGSIQHRPTTVNRVASNNYFFILPKSLQPHQFFHWPWASVHKFTIERNLHLLLELINQKKKMECRKKTEGPLSVVIVVDVCLIGIFWSARTDKNRVRREHSIAAVIADNGN